MANSNGYAGLYVKNKVFGGRPSVFSSIVSVSSGTGNASTNGNQIGMFSIDKSSGSIFLCTATTGTGTWVRVYVGTSSV